MINWGLSITSILFFSDQSKFLNASKILKNPDTEKDMVKVLEYHVAETYAEKVYKSCADVVNPSTSGILHMHLIWVKCGK